MIPGLEHRSPVDWAEEWTAPGGERCLWEALAVTFFTLYPVVAMSDPLTCTLISDEAARRPAGIIKDIREQ